MSFDAGAGAYDRFMGRYSRPLALGLCDRLALRPRGRVLDVGCGTGALTAALASRVGPEWVHAVDPSDAFTRAVRSTVTANVARAAAERLPFADASFEATAAQLVVHFMRDPVVGLAEMARVTTPGGTVAVSVWDHGGSHGPLAAFWSATRELDPAAPDESSLAGVRAGQLARLCADAGLRVIDDTAATVSVGHADFDDWWQPFTLSVGPAGAYVASCSDEQREALRERCRAHLPDGPFTVDATAWTVIAEPAEAPTRDR